MEATSFSNLSGYCTVTNFLMAIETISEDLSVVGLPPVVKYDEQNPALTTVSLINTIWSLLQNRQHVVDAKRVLEQKIVVLLEELNYGKEKQKRFEKSLVHNEDDLIKQKKLVLLMEQEKSEVLQKSKYLKQEVQELKLQLKNSELQYKHAFQKQQNEIAALQTKLRKLLMKEKGDICRGPIDNSLKLKFSEEDRIKSMESLYKKSIYRLESNVQTLIKENLEFRKLLDSVSRDLSHLLKQTKQHEFVFEEKET